MVFGDFKRAVQGTLHGGHVVHRLGHHPGQLLEARVAVKLKRVEVLTGGTGRFQAGVQLSIGLQFDVTQLLAQTAQVIRQVSERATDLTHLRSDPGAGNADFARVVDQAVQQLRTHAHHSLHGSLRVVSLGCHGQATAVVGQGGPVDHGGDGRGSSHVHRRRFNRSRQVGGRHGTHHSGGQRLNHARHRLDRFGRWQGLADFGVVGLRIALRQGLELFDQRINAGFKWFDIATGDRLGANQVLDGGFKAVGQLAQAHGTSQAGAAFEGVQGAHAGGRRGRVGGLFQPLAHLAGQLRQQFLRFFFENGEKVGVDGVVGFQVVAIVQAGDAVGLAHGGRGSGGQHLGQRIQRLDLGLAQGAGLGREHFVVGRLVKRRIRHRCFIDRMHQAQVPMASALVRTRFAIFALAGVQFAQQAARFQAARGGVVVDLQAMHQVVVGGLEETRGELVQQVADVVGCFIEQGGHFRLTTAQGMGAHQAVLQQARQLRQFRVAHGGGIARQRVRQGNRVF